MKNSTQRRCWKVPENDVEQFHIATWKFHFLEMILDHKYIFLLKEIVLLKRFLCNSSPFELEGSSVSLVARKYACIHCTLSFENRGINIIRDKPDVSLFSNLPKNFSNYNINFNLRTLHIAFSLDQKSLQKLKFIFLFNIC